MMVLPCPKHGEFCWHVVNDWLRAMTNGMGRGHCAPAARPGECLIDARDAGRVAWRS